MKPGLRRLVRRLPLMIASLLLALFLWMLVIAEEKIEAGFMVPLVFDNIPSSVVIDKSPMSSVYVQIRGSKQAVSNVLPQQIQASVNLSHVTPGDEFVQITAQDIIFPPGISVLGVFPPYLDLRFLAKRPVTVRVRTVGKPAEGFEVKGVAAIPLQVEIVGPQESVQAIKQVETYPVDINGLVKRMQVRVEVVQPGDDIRLLQLKPTEVVVDVGAKQITRTFRKVPVQGGNEKAELSPASVTVIVEGPYHQVKELAVEAIAVNVDWEAAGDAALRPLTVTVPQGVAVHSFKPAEVKIK